MQELNLKKIKSDFMVSPFLSERINWVIQRSHGFSQFAQLNDEISYAALLIAIKAFNLSSVEVDHLLSCSDSDFEHDFNGIRNNFPNPEAQGLGTWNGFVPYCAAPPVKGLRPAYLPERLYINQKCYFPEYCDSKNIVLMSTGNSIRKSLDKTFYCVERGAFDRLLNENNALEMQGFPASNNRVIIHDVDLDKYSFQPISPFLGKELIIDNKDSIEYLSGEFNVFTLFTLKRIEEAYRNDDKMYLDGYENDAVSKDVAKEGVRYPGLDKEKVAREAKEISQGYKKDNGLRETVVEGR